MKTTVTLKHFAILCKSQKSATQFVKELNALCDKFQDNPLGTTFKYDFEQ